MYNWGRLLWIFHLKECGLNWNIKRISNFGQNTLVPTHSLLEVTGQLYTYISTQQYTHAHIHTDTMQTVPKTIMEVWRLMLTKGLKMKSEWRNEQWVLTKIRLELYFKGPMMFGIILAKLYAIKIKSA